MADPRVHGWKTLARDVAQVVVGDGDCGACCLHVGKLIGGEYAQRYAWQEAVRDGLAALRPWSVQLDVALAASDPFGRRYRTGGRELVP